MIRKAHPERSVGKETQNERINFQFKDQTQIYMQHTATAILHTHRVCMCFVWFSQ